MPVSSQMLVFSKTSLQRQRISPRHPRALYFNDDVYVGFCQGGDVLEISAVDPQLGTVFYTLDQDGDRASRASPARPTTACSATAPRRRRAFPGHLVRSVFADADGQPILLGGTYRIDQTSPLEKRWGGWYVTGTTASRRTWATSIVARRAIRGRAGQRRRPERHRPGRPLRHARPT